MLRRLITGFLMLGILGACASPAAPKNDNTVTISKEDKELLDRLKAKERARLDLQKNPAKYVQSAGWQNYDSGIINRYSKAVAIEFVNNSQFDVSDIEGRITYATESGQEMATVPFTAEGDVRAGERKKLTVTAQEISGAAKQGKVIVERVRVLGS